MKKICSCLLIFCILLSLVTPCFAEGASDPSQPEETAPQTTEADVQQAAIHSSCKTLDSQAPIAGSTHFALSGRSAIVYDYASDTLISTYNADLRAYPGSQTKIMVCLLAAENLDGNETILVTQNAIDSVPDNSYHSGFINGEKVTVSDLMHAAMLDSGNDAVAILATRISGNVDDFVELMNTRAAEIGCTGTHFQNPYGIQHTDHYTTARDMARIVAEGMGYKSFWECYTAERYEMPATEYSESRRFYTDNYLRFQSSMFSYYDPRVQGGRTCVTQEDVYNLVVTIKQGEMQLIVVVMEAGYVFDEKIYGIVSFGNIDDAITLYDYAFDNYQFTNVTYSGQSITQCAVANGANDVVLSAKNSVSTILPKGVRSTDIRQVISLKKDMMTAPLDAGLTVGTLELWYGSICVGSTDLVTQYSVGLGSADNPLEPIVQVEGEEAAKSNIMANLLQALGGIFLVVLVLFGFLAFRSSRIRSKQKKRSDRQRRASGRRG